MVSKSTSVSAPPDLANHCLAITEHAPLPMATVEGATRIVRYANPAFCHLMGKPSPQLVGKSLEELLPEKDRCLTLLDHVLRTGKAESYTEKEQSGIHSTFWSYTIWPVRENELGVGIMIQVTETAQAHATTVELNEALILGALHQHELREAAEKLNEQLQVEINARKGIEDELRHAHMELSDRALQLQNLVAERTSELTATNKQLEAFIYSIAHDLRAPLRAMQGFSTMLVADAGSTLSEKGRDFAERINNSAQFMDALLQDLLAFSRVAQQRIELTSVNLEMCVRAALSHSEAEIRKKNATVKLAGQWPAVRAHEPTLGQVLSNLLENALKFVEPNVKPLIHIHAEERGRLVRVWVEDNGVGIAPTHQEQIFRLFTRLRGDKFPGTGIGLAIVQKGVERMGGRVGVESSPGQGSRFWFECEKWTDSGAGPNKPNVSSVNSQLL